jgi:hypothetical protein
VVTREIIEGYSKTKNILELAGGPLNSTGPLTVKGYHITTIDLDQGSLSYSQNKYRNVTTIKANLESGLPKIPGIENMDVFVALDVLEHLTREKAVSLLKDIKEAKKDQDYIVIITMPIIDFTKITTWYEFLYIPFHLGQRPATGLFDRTHKILTDQKGCREIFKEAGFQLINEYATNSFTGITGKWKTFNYEMVPWKLYKQTKYIKFLASFLSYIFHPLSKTKRDAFRIKVTEHRGFFVIKPEK